MALLNIWPVNMMLDPSTVQRLWMTKLLCLNCIRAKIHTFGWPIIKRNSIIAKESLARDSRHVIIALCYHSGKEIFDWPFRLSSDTICFSEGNVTIKDKSDIILIVRIFLNCIHFKNENFGEFTIKFFKYFWFNLYELGKFFSTKFQMGANFFSTWGSFLNSNFRIDLKILIILFFRFETVHA